MAATTAGLLPPAPTPATAAAVDNQSWIAFADNGSIAVAHPDGSGRQVVASPPAPNPQQEAYGYPDLSPDGRRIAFTSCAMRNGALDCRLLVVDRSTGVRQDITPNDGGEGAFSEPAWSPAGDRLLYDRRSMDRSHAFVVRADGTEPQLVEGLVGADWGPDGDHVVGTTDHGMAIRSLTTGEERVLAPGGAYPRWSPDGQRIVYVRYIPAFRQVIQTLSVVNVDGSGRRDIFGGFDPVVWSPDSRMLASAGQDSTGEHRMVRVRDLSGKLVSEVPDAQQPSWSNPAGVVPCTHRYRLVGADGGVFTFGGASFHGSTGGMRLNRPVVGVAATSTGDGYWLLGGDGGVFTFGDAAFHGSTGGMRLDAPVLAMAATSTDDGYWLVAGDGGIFTFGDAKFYGSTGGKRLDEPVVGMAPTPTGLGYWLVAADGGVFTFGDAKFFGSTGGTRLAAQIVALVPTPAGRGYWLVAADGGVFTFGDAAFPGSASAPGLGSPVVAAAKTADENGLLLTTADGQVVPLGDAGFCGSRYGKGERMVGVAA